MLTIKFDTRAAPTLVFPPIIVQHVGGDPYDGEYTVKPDFEGTVLPTLGKTMLDDVTVEAIEVQRVSNPSGGRTIYIGGLIDG